MNDNAPRCVHLRCAVSHAEYEACFAAAKRAGVPLARWLRDLALGCATVDRHRDNESNREFAERIADPAVRAILNDEFEPV
jgi:hypothetical protein